MGYEPKVVRSGLSFMIYHSIKIKNFIQFFYALWRSSFALMQKKQKIKP